MGCGAGGVSTPRRPVATVEEIDPFEYGDEFAFRLKGIRRDASLDKPSGGSSALVPENSRAAAPDSTEEIPSPEAAGAPESAGGKSSPSPETRVYRVQIGIFEERQSAERRAEEARSQVDQKVYVEFEPPFYRVRVGEFKTRKEAEEYVKILQDYGFRGSFWVMKNINTP
ncbi:MAG: SPOR domain-containing protein [Candidatus Latescibacterota bacterium]